MPDQPSKESLERAHQIKHMVDRFLGWRLPENFNPDAGISFKAMYNEHFSFGPMKHEPTGTNLFDATQAEEMVRYMLAELPDTAAELRQPNAALVSALRKLAQQWREKWAQTLGMSLEDSIYRRCAASVEQLLSLHGHAEEAQYRGGDGAYWRRRLLCFASACSQSLPQMPPARPAGRGGEDGFGAQATS